MSNRQFGSNVLSVVLLVGSVGLMIAGEFLIGIPIAVAWYVLEVFRWYGDAPVRYKKYDLKEEWRIHKINPQPK